MYLLVELIALCMQFFLCLLRVKLKNFLDLRMFGVNLDPRRLHELNFRLRVSNLLSQSGLQSFRHLILSALTLVRLSQLQF